MKNLEDKELVKNRDNTAKSNQNAKMLSQNYPEEGVVRVSYFIRLVDDKHFIFNPPKGFKRFVSKEEWTILAQVRNSKLNYCQVTIMENLFNLFELM